MDQRIFSLGLSVEAISLYLILDDLVSSNVPLAEDSYMHRWNSSREKLEEAISELVMHSVVDRTSGHLSIRPPGDWKEIQRS